MSRHANRRSWLYRIRPSVVHEPFRLVEPAVDSLTADSSTCVSTPNQLRWLPFPMPGGAVDFAHGLFTLCCAGSASAKDGYAIHMYAATISMEDCCLGNADGDFLLVPQQGAHAHKLQVLSNARRPRSRPCYRLCTNCRHAVHHNRAWAADGCAW